MTTTSITAVSASTRSAQSTFSEPDWIQVSTGTTAGPRMPADIPKKIGQLRNAPMNSEPVVTDLGRGLADPAAEQAGDDRGESGRKTMKDGAS